MHIIVCKDRDRRFEWWKMAIERSLNWELSETAQHGRNERNAEGFA